MSNTKIQKSYRLNPDTITAIDDTLIDHYKEELLGKTGINVSISAGTVIELLVSEKMEELKVKS